MSWFPTKTLATSIGLSNQARTEAAYAKSNARLAEQLGANDAALIREKAHRLSGENRAAIGASGVDISGSFIDALTDNDINAEVDAQTALWNSKLDATNYRTRAREASARGKQELMRGVFGAGTAIISHYF